MAALRQKAIESIGELADGWLGTSFIPEAAADVVDHLAGRALPAANCIVG